MLFLGGTVLDGFATHNPSCKAAGPGHDMIEQIFEHRFPSGLALPIAVLAVSLDDVATRFCIALQSWDEDGLGAARGMLMRLPSGKIILIRELAHMVKHMGSPGPDIIADGGDVLSFGVDALVAEVVLALGLSERAVAWNGGEEVRHSAARILGATERHRKSTR
jgi:hypothetical protein